MSTVNHDHGRGLLIAAIGGLALTADIPLIRLSGGEPWSVMLLRTATTFAAAVVIWSIWRAITPKAPPLIPGWSGLVVAILYGLTSITFIAAIYNTSTADVVFILAFNTVFSGLFSWAILKERPGPATMLAMAAMIVGVAIIVSDSLGKGQLFGDVMALCSALCVALAITLSRASGKDMGFASLAGVIFPLALALYMVAGSGYRIEAPWWLVLDGVVIMPISFFCLAAAPRFISGAEVAMFYLLETVFAPVWVWMIFADTPSKRSLAGGVILIVALVAHSLWQLHQGRKRRAALAVRHPA